MKKNNIIQNLSFAFALEIIKTCKSLELKQKEYVLSKQLYRSGTSIGADVEYAIGATSRKEFIYKISISYREARETKYWTTLLKESKIIDVENADFLHDKVLELIRILGKVQINSKNNITTAGNQ